MTSTIIFGGRLCNHIYRNLVVHMIAKHNNLFVIYKHYDQIKELGIDLFIGEMGRDGYTEIYEHHALDFMKGIQKVNTVLWPAAYYQTKEISNYLYEYLRTNEVQ